MDTRKKDSSASTTTAAEGGARTVSPPESTFITSLTTSSTSDSLQACDLATNTGCVGVGIDYDTAAFAVVTIARWDAVGRAAYLGRCQAAHHRRRRWVQRLPDPAVENRAGHPWPLTPACRSPSATYHRWNKIEHRLVSHIVMKWRRTSPDQPRSDRRNHHPHRRPASTLNSTTSLHHRHHEPRPGDESASRPTAPSSAGSRYLPRRMELAKLCPTKSVRTSQVWCSRAGSMGVASMVLAPQRNDTHLTCIYALRVEVNISRRSGWRRSATLTAGPRVSLPENRKPITAWLVGLGRSPVKL
jgi:DDE family transposase